MGTKRMTLTAARANARLSQQAVAEKMNVNRWTVSDWEKGKQEPSISQAYELSRIYGVPVNVIFFDYISRL